MNKTNAKVGDVIRATASCHGITAGTLYYVHNTSDGKVSGSTYQVIFRDDNKNERAFYYPTDYEIVGTLQECVLGQPQRLKDIHGQPVQKGDYVSFADQGYLKVLEVLSISNNTIANCRDIATGNTAFYGCFEDRALKLKDYTK